ncbi:transposase [Corynebacterium mayonis]|uniref:transposase n=1 Tax=Corynebacterium mayonis TaxID=3062461 RepID=UPI0031408392
MFQTIFQQPDANNVRHHARDVVEFCQQRFPHVADYLEESLGDLLAFTHGPKPENSVDENLITPPHRLVEQKGTSPVSCPTSTTPSCICSRR